MTKLRKMIFSGAAGFTLLEVLVALALLALIMGYMLGAGTFGKRAWETAQNLEKLSGVGATRDFLRRRISRARFIRRTPAIISFSGRVDQLQFHSDSDGVLDRSGLYSTVLFVEDNAGTRVLRMQKTLLQSTPKTSAALPIVSEQILIENIDSIKFRYYGFQTRSKGSENWHSKWDSLYRLPKLVSIMIIFRDGIASEYMWPDLIIETKLNN